jgi:hypothetical protein
MSGRTTRERRDARADRLDNAAVNNTAKAEAAFGASHDATAGIPFGQPILVGHHSEKRHRSALKRSDAAMRRSVEASGKATDQASRAANIRAANDQAIYDDDEDAVEALRAKIEGLEAQRERIKEYNKSCRQAVKDGRPVGDTKLLDEAQQKDLLSCARAGQVREETGGKMPPYVLSNLGGVINTAKKRLEQLSQPERGRVLVTRFAGECRNCGATIGEGETARYFKRTRDIQCEPACDEEEPTGC